MSAPDLMNGMFEMCGSVLTWMNVRAVYRARGYAGITIPAAMFFTAWGGWNLYYYPHLGQWLSFHGGLSLFAANVAWLGLMLSYGRLK